MNQVLEEGEEPAILPPSPAKGCAVVVMLPDQQEEEEREAGDDDDGDNDDEMPDAASSPQPCPQSPPSPPPEPAVHSFGSAWFEPEDVLVMNKEGQQRSFKQKGDLDIMEAGLHSMSFDLHCQIGHERERQRHEERQMIFNARQYAEGLQSTMRVRQLVGQVAGKEHVFVQKPKPRLEVPLMVQPEVEEVAPPPEPTSTPPKTEPAPEPLPVYAPLEPKPWVPQSAADPLRSTPVKASPKLELTSPTKIPFQNCARRMSEVGRTSRASSVNTNIGPQVERRTSSVNVDCPTEDYSNVSSRVDTHRSNLAPNISGLRPSISNKQPSLQVSRATYEDTPRLPELPVQKPEVPPKIPGPPPPITQQQQQQQQQGLVVSAAPITHQQSHWEPPAPTTLQPGLMVCRAPTTQQQQHSHWAPPPPASVVKPQGPWTSPATSVQQSKRQTEVGKGSVLFDIREKPQSVYERPQPLHWWGNPRQASSCLPSKTNISEGHQSGLLSSKSFPRQNRLKVTAPQGPVSAPNLPPSPMCGNTSVGNMRDGSRQDRLKATAPQGPASAPDLHLSPSNMSASSNSNMSVGSNSRSGTLPVVGQSAQRSQQSELLGSQELQVIQRATSSSSPKGSGGSRTGRSSSSPKGLGGRKRGWDPLPLTRGLGVGYQLGMESPIVPGSGFQASVQGLRSEGMGFVVGPRARANGHSGSSRPPATAPDKVSQEVLRDGGQVARAQSSGVVEEGGVGVEGNGQGLAKPPATAPEKVNCEVLWRDGAGGLARAESSGVVEDGQGVCGKDGLGVGVQHQGEGENFVSSEGTEVCSRGKHRKGDGVEEERQGDGGVCESSEGAEVCSRGKGEMGDELGEDADVHDADKVVVTVKLTVAAKESQEEDGKILCTVSAVQEAQSAWCGKAHTSTQGVTAAPSLSAPASGVGGGGGGAAAGDGCGVGLQAADKWQGTDAKGLLKSKQPAASMGPAESPDAHDFGGSAWRAQAAAANAMAWGQVQQLTAAAWAAALADEMQRSRSSRHLPLPSEIPTFSQASHSYDGASFGQWQRQSPSKLKAFSQASHSYEGASFSQCQQQPRQQQLRPLSQSQPNIAVISTPSPNEGAPQGSPTLLPPLQGARNGFHPPLQDARHGIPFPLQGARNGGPFPLQGGRNSISSPHSLSSSPSHGQQQHLAPNHLPTANRQTSQEKRTLASPTQQAPRPSGSPTSLKGVTGGCHVESSLVGGLSKSGIHCSIPGIGPISLLQGGQPRTW